MFVSKIIYIFLLKWVLILTVHSRNGWFPEMAYINLNKHKSILSGLCLGDAFSFAHSTYGNHFVDPTRKTFFLVVLAGLTVHLVFWSTLFLMVNVAYFSCDIFNFHAVETYVFEDIRRGNAYILEKQTCTDGNSIEKLDVIPN